MNAISVRLEQNTFFSIRIVRLHGPLNQLLDGLLVAVGMDDAIDFIDQSAVSFDGDPNIKPFSDLFDRCLLKGATHQKLTSVDFTHKLPPPVTTQLRMLLSENGDGDSVFEMAANPIASRRGTASHTAVLGNHRFSMLILQFPTKSIVNGSAVVELALCIKHFVAVGGKQSGVLLPQGPIPFGVVKERRSHVARTVEACAVRGFRHVQRVKDASLLKIME